MLLSENGELQNHKLELRSRCSWWEIELPRSTQSLETSTQQGLNKQELNKTNSQLLGLRVYYTFGLVSKLYIGGLIYTLSNQRYPTASTLTGKGECKLTKPPWKPPRQNKVKSPSRTYANKQLKWKLTNVVKTGIQSPLPDPKLHLLKQDPIHLSNKRKSSHKRHTLSSTLQLRV